MIPKPLQKPHPPVWVACTRPVVGADGRPEGDRCPEFRLHRAGTARRSGSTATTRSSRRGARPITPAMNPNMLAIGGDLSMMVAKTDEEALKRLGIGGGFFSFGIMHYYMTGMHTPGRTGVWERYRRGQGGPDARLRPGPRCRSARPTRCGSSCAATRTAASTRSSCCSTPRSHEGTMESIEMMGKDILPEFIERDAEGGRRQGQAPRAGDREGRGAPRVLERAAVRRDLRVRRPAHRPRGKFTAGEIPEAMAEINEGRVRRPRNWRRSKAARGTRRRRS